jgi:hypothetical protein
MCSQKDELCTPWGWFNSLRNLVICDLKLSSLFFLTFWYHSTFLNTYISSINSIVNATLLATIVKLTFRKSIRRCETMFSTNLTLFNFLSHLNEI